MKPLLYYTVLVLATNSILFAQDEPATPTEAPGQGGFLINFNNVAITEYLRFISRISGQNFIFDPQDLDFNVTIMSEEKTSISEIMAALMQELRIHNLSLIEEGSNLIIHSNTNVNGPSTIVAEGVRDSIPPNAQVVTRVFTLRSFSPEKAAQIIKPLLSNLSIIEPLDDTSHLVLTDISSNVEKVGKLLKSLDSPASGLDIGRYVAQYILIDSLQALAERIMGPLTEGKTFTLVPFRETNTLYIISTPTLVDRAINILRELDRGLATPGQSSSNIEENLPVTGRIGPNGEVGGGTNAAPGPEGQGNRAQGTGPNGAVNPYGANTPGLSPILQELLNRQNGGQNKPGVSALPLGHIESTEFAIYKLNYRKGDQIQNALQQIAASMGNAQLGSDELLTAIQTVQWIEASNTLVFTGTHEAVLKIKSLIEDLDTPNQQVLIEMLILDTTINDSLNFGTDWGTRFDGPNSAGAQGFFAPSSPLPTALGVNNVGLGSTTIDGSILASTPGFNLGVIGRNITHCGLSFSSIGALVNALRTDTRSNIVMNPKIVVEDNVAAKIFVGLNIPYQTQSVANDFGTTITNNFEYIDVGTTLQVTPQIGRNGVITLQIQQEMSSLVNSSTVITTSVFQPPLGAGPTTKKANTSTTIFVPSGFFVILSGMIQDQFDKVRTQVPCLGGIPVIGAAFSQKQNQDQKRNLMLFIRPTLLNTQDDMCEQTEREQKIYEDFNRQLDGWGYEVEEALDLFNVRIDCNEN